MFRGRQRFQGSLRVAPLAIFESHIYGSWTSQKCKIVTKTILKNLEFDDSKLFNLIFFTFIFGS